MTESKMYTVTATGKNKLEILNRITSLYLQRHIVTESVQLESLEDNQASYKVVALTNLETIETIVHQIENIVGITNTELK